MVFLRSLGLWLVVITSGCFQSVLVPADEDPPQRYEIPFDRDVIAASGAPYGVHLQGLESSPFEATTSLLGIETSGRIVYEHRFDGPVMLVGPVSDAKGRPYVVYRAGSPDPMDFGFGPQVPLGKAGNYGTLVAYSERGVPRFAVPIPTGMSAVSSFQGIDVSDEGVVVVCGSVRVVSGMVAVWVFEPDGTLRASAEFAEPALEKPPICAIDEDGNVLLFGPEADLDHTSASVENSGLVLLDDQLRVRASFVHSRMPYSLDADPRGDFVVLSHAYETPAYVGTHTVPPTARGGLMLSVVSPRTTSVHVVAATKDDVSFRGVPLVHDARGVIAPYAFLGGLVLPSGELVEANARAAVAFLGFDDEGGVSMPVVTPLADEDAAPDFAGMMGNALVLVNQREDTLVLDVHHRLRAAP